MDMRTPVKSSMSFVAPDAVVKASPSIKNLMNDHVPKAAPPVTISTPTSAPAPESPSVPEQAAPVAVSEPAAPSQPVEPEPVAPVQEQPSAPEPMPQPEPTPSAPQPAPSPAPVQPMEESPEQHIERFKAQWNEMVDCVFNKVPTLQAPLKNYPLELRNNTIYLKLRNSMQVDDFSIKKVAVLQYLRNHFDPNINEVEVELDDKTEAKKYILDEKDKIKELQHQNPDFAEFMQTLNLQSCN